MIYKNAPIVEAIFDVKVNQTQGGLEALEKIGDLVREHYPVKKARIDFQGSLKIAEGKAPETKSESKKIGFIYANEDSTRQFQARLNGFTFNMLSPYTNWSDFSQEAFRLLEKYREVANPSDITRIALRYINKIMLPYPFKKFEDYIINMPSIPQSLPQTYERFLMQIQVPVEDNIRTIITETIEPLSEGNKLPFLLDIDVVDTDVHSFDVLESKFGKLRELKNNIFESCITDKSRELFNN